MSARVRPHLPPGGRACGGEPNRRLLARDERGALPLMGDIEFLRNRFPSAEARELYMADLHDHMLAAERGELPWDKVTLMAVAPDVLEVRLPDHFFAGGRMHVRLYFAEPYEMPGHIVWLRLQAKRPGPLGLQDQDEMARSASDLLLAYARTGFPS